MSASTVAACEQGPPVSPKSHIFHLPMPQGPEMADIELSTSEGAVVVTVPAVLNRCFCFIFDHGLVEGVFRINGSTKRVNAYFLQLSQCEQWLSAADDERPLAYDVCGVIKRFLKAHLASADLVSASTASQIRALHVQHSADGDFLADVATLLWRRNPPSKNLLVLYLVHTLQRLACFQETTKMTSLNYSIIFQPYVLASTAIEDLRPYQEVLQRLIDNADALVAVYRNLGPQNALETALFADTTSLESVESCSASPVTNHSNEVAIAPLLLPPVEEKSRRRSLTQRFSMLLDSYYSPTPTPKTNKRFSFNMSNVSLGRSTDELAVKTEKNASVYSTVAKKASSEALSPKNTIVGGLQDKKSDRNVSSEGLAGNTSSEQLCGSVKSGISEENLEANTAEDSFQSGVSDAPNTSTETAETDVFSPVVLQDRTRSVSSLPMAKVRNSSSGQSRNSSVYKSRNSSVVKSSESLLRHNSGATALITPETGVSAVSLVEKLQERPLAEYSVSRRASKRMSIIRLFRSNGSTASLSETSVTREETSKDATPRSVSSPYTHTNKSIDDGLISSASRRRRSLFLPELKPNVLTRHFSLRLKLGK